MIKLVIFALALLLTACSSSASPPSTKQWTSAPSMRIDIGKQYVASIETDRGIIQADLLAREAPNTVNNFVFLAREGFYDGMPFHRIIKDFMVQTGDPSGTGRGGPGYRIIDEPVTLNYDRGTLAMANSGVPNTGASQFFIVQGSNVFLPKTYTIFGKVTTGLDALDAIASVPVSGSPQGELSVPQEVIKIKRVQIQER